MVNYDDGKGLGKFIFVFGFFTYIGDIAIKSVSNIHLTHSHKNPSSVLQVDEIPGPQLQIGYFRHLDWLVADGFGNLLINLQEGSEDGVCAHIGPVDYLL